MSRRARVLLVGAGGRLGRCAEAALAECEDLEVVARIGRGDDVARAAADARAELAFEATRAGLGFGHAKALLEAGVRPLVATSGVTPEEARSLDALARARGLGGLVAPNLSLGMWVLQRAALDAARWFPNVEIVELHHERKADAPSGTALDTARRLAEVVGGTRAIPIHSVRLPGLYAHQEVLLGAPGELLTLRHDMSSPDAFRPGIVAGLRYVARALGVEIGIDAAFCSEGRVDTRD
jgi:4-hydroxy-tetrahydrodipicolinate reductase